MTAGADNGKNTGAGGAALTRMMAVACTLALIVLGLAWELWLSPTGRGTLALKVLPLLPILPGLWRDHLRTYRWTSLLVWLYVTEALVRATSDRGAGAWLASVELLLCLLLFGAVGAHVRSRLRAVRSAAAIDSTTAGGGAG